MSDLRTGEGRLALLGVLLGAVVLLGVVTGQIRLLAVAFALLSSPWTVREVVLLVHAVRSRSWPHVFGWVTFSQVVCIRLARYAGSVPVADLDYRYAVDGVEYRGSRVAFGPVLGQGAHDLVARYPIGETVMVYYDPRRPQRAVLQPEVRWSQGVALAFSLALSLLLIFAVTSVEGP